MNHPTQDALSVSAFTRRLRTLYSPETRTYRKRLILAALTMLSLLFTVCIFGPFDIYQSNQAYFPFYINDLLLSMCILSLVLLFAGSLLISLLKGKLFDGSISFFIALSLGLWIQGNYLNLNLGQLDGAFIQWNDYTLHSLGNLVVWLAIFVLVFFVRYISKKIWANVVQYISILLIGMQLAAFVNLLIVIPEKEYVFGISMEKEFQLSSDQNLVVFVLDSYAGDTIDQVRQVYPNLLDGFSDFTFFRNYSNAIYGTFPSMTTMMTGRPFDPQRSHLDFFESSWASPQAKALYDGLKARNYERNLFVSTIYSTGGVAEYLLGNCDNLTSEKSMIHYPTLVKKMLRLSAYRYAPHTLKPTFWVEPGEITQIASSAQLWADYQTDDNSTFYQRLVDQRISARNPRNVFAYYHIMGVHPPFSINEKAQKADSTDFISVARGSFAIIEEYMAQMKALGIYDNATIIIAGDHSDKHPLRPSTLLMIKRQGEKHERIVINEAPVAQADFQPTLLQLAGLEYSSYGRSVYDVAEGESRPRTWAMWVADPNYPRKPVSGYDSVLYEYDFDCHVDNVPRFDAKFPPPPTRIVEYISSLY